MKIGFLLGARNKQIIQIKTIFELLSSNINNNLYILYDYMTGRNSSSYDFNDLTNWCKKFNIHMIKNNYNNFEFDYLLISDPYQIVINENYRKFIVNNHTKTKIIYLPYDLSTSINCDLKWENNNRYNVLLNNLEYIDIICVYDKDTYNMLSEHLPIEKLKLIGCPRYNGKPNKIKHSRKTILYNPRWCIYDKNYESTKLTHIDEIVYNTSNLSKEAYLYNSKIQSVCTNHIVIPQLIDFAKRNRDYDIVIRFHPEFIIKNISEYNYIKLMCSEYNNIYFDENSIDSNYWLSRSDYVISEYSSWNIDVIRYDLPCVQIVDYHRMLNIYKECYHNLDIITNKIDNVFDEVIKLDNKDKTKYISEWHLWDNNTENFIKELIYGTKN